MTVRSAAQLGVPATFNAAAHFVDRNVHDGRGDHVAIECGEARITYREVLDQVNRCGNALRDRLGVRPEERILLLLLDGPAFVYAFFGAMKIGAVAVPVNTQLKPADCAFLLDDTRARVLIVSQALLPVIEGIPLSDRRYLRHIVVSDHGAEGMALSFDRLLRQASPVLDAEPTSRDEAAFWLYSSGSTGAPKGCVHLHHDMVVCAELVGKGVLGLRPSDRCFSVAKLFFAYGLGNALYFPFAVGATAVLWPGRPVAADVYRVIERHRPTVFYSVPTGYGMLLAHTPEREGPGQAREFDLSSIRLAVSAGEALPVPLFERFKARFGIEILDGIGSTEALQMFILNPPGRVRPGSSGLIVPGYEAEIRDDEGRVVPPGEIGNLWISGDSVCASYWNRHDKTQETLHGRWLRTGDKYTQDADGYFWYAGRTDDMLKVGGQWVSPLEVESALLAHPSVQECAVIGDEDHDALVKPHAFVVLTPDAIAEQATADQLQQFVRTRLAEYKRPRWVTFLADLPKTATGKIQRFKLREGSGGADIGGAGEAGAAGGTGAGR